MSIGYRDVCEAESKEEMLSRFDALLKELCEREGGTPESHRAIQLSNVGYFSGYYSSATGKRVLDWLGATHPIFGRAHADGTLTPERALEYDFNTVRDAIVTRMGGHTISFSEMSAWRSFMGLLKQVKESECFIASPLERK